MNKSAFLKLIKQVSDISDQQQSELEQVAATFPYCQTAHLLLAKSAYDKGSMLSTQRLRRASAYATDRQLLKRLIYASPVLEPAFADDTEVSEAEPTTALPIPAETQEAENNLAHAVDGTEQDENAAIPKRIIPEDQPSGITAADLEEENAIPEATQEEEAEEAIPEAEVETLDQVYHHTSAENPDYIAQGIEETDDAENPEAEIDSELALLFTFSSISTSSTDLLRHRDIEADLTEQEATSPADGMHLSETAEALHDLEEAQEVAPDAPAVGAIPEEDTNEAVPAHSEQQDTAAVPIDEADTSGDATETAIDGAAANDITVPDVSQPADEEAEINYSFDEIDRLYAEDALGYWMGSSRMGEVLQLKDDYTRLRPQSFHPELILEYSKTHELEKAIQPTTHVLSRQLDIIDHFLKLNPKLKTMANLKLKPEPQEDLSLKSSKIKKGMASESLANIFIKQGKPKKAVKIYEQLILKYPEKKSYFAEQIEKLQNIT
jgi:tetratricopeptide (TPR) repeat protein